jgi:8-oxo-dGTP pyrophosphatase MutT (NUDIX family)
LIEEPSFDSRLVLAEGGELESRHEALGLAFGRLSVDHEVEPFLEGFGHSGEDAAQACRREFNEETGLLALKLHDLGSYAPCTARLSNRLHSFFVETGARADKHAAEAGIEFKLVTPAELGGLISVNAGILVRLRGACGFRFLVSRPL